MLSHYLILDIAFDASNEDIRKSYLTLVKKHTPENDPVRFQQITEAYEAVKDKRHRISGKFFGGFLTKDVETELIKLVKTRKIKRQRVGLKTLLKVESNR